MRCSFMTRADTALRTLLRCAFIYFPAEQACFSVMAENAGTSSAPTEDDQATSGTGASDAIVQYVVLRRDLWREQAWPLGSIIAQGCHASTAALWEGRESATTQQYCAPQSLGSMTKVVLEVKGEPQLRTLAGKLEQAGVLHHLWIEQPEGYATCLATHPCPRSQIVQHFKKLNLCKGTP